MQKQVMAVAILCFVAACGKSPTAPNQISKEELAATPSNQTEVLSISAVKTGTINGKTEYMVQLRENFNAGLSAGRAPSDWNGAMLYVVRNCDGREKTFAAEYASGSVSPTSKHQLDIPNVENCDGSNNIRFRLQYSARGSVSKVDFDFPTGARLILNGLTLGVDATSTPPTKYLTGNLR